MGIQTDLHEKLVEQEAPSCQEGFQGEVHSSRKFVDETSQQMSKLREDALSKDFVRVPKPLNTSALSVAGEPYIIAGESRLFRTLYSTSQKGRHFEDQSQYDLEVKVWTEPPPRP